MAKHREETRLTELRATIDNNLAAQIKKAREKLGMHSKAEYTRIAAAEKTKNILSENAARNYGGA